MAKKNTKPTQQPLSPTAYIKQKGRSLEIYECYIPKDNFPEGEGVVIVTRRHNGGNLTFGCFLVDIYCMGVKDCFVAFRRSEEEYKDYLNQVGQTQGLEKVPYEIAHNWIFGAIDFASEAGIDPHKDFALAKYILEDDENEDIPIIDLPFGDKGKHHLILDDLTLCNKLEPVLREHLGEGNYQVTYVDRQI